MGVTLRFRLHGLIKRDRRYHPQPRPFPHQGGREKGG